MRVLHLSDLHITDPFRTLAEVWQGPAARLTESSFSAIIVSGDLSCRAEPDEYKALRLFAEDTLLKLVVGNDRRRIVFVPGNHDVDWSRNVYRHIPADELLIRGGPSALESALMDFEKNGGRSKHRVLHTPFGRSELYEIDRSTYADRFRNVQQFLDEFYQTSAAAAGEAGSEAKLDGENPDALEAERVGGKDVLVHRGFKLAHEGQDWSGHILRDDRLVIAGFNSCYNNDRYWHGAHIDPTAVAAATRFADEHGKGCLKVAVWHHGLQSDEFRPDHLPLVDIGTLFNAGFRIGFHGHLHRADSDTFGRLFGGRFAIVSTGSLGAGPKDRPDAAANQFSISTINPSQVRAEVFSRRGDSGIYVPSAPKTIFLEAIEDDARLAVADEHFRVYKVASDGLAEVSVELRHVRLSGPLVLAVLSPPYCSAAYVSHATSPLGHHPVEERRLPDGRLQYTMRDHVGQELERLTWEYQVTNAVALNSNDLTLRDPPPWEHVPLKCEARPHVVRILSNRLAIAYRFDDDVIEGDAVPIVLRKCELDGVSRTRRVPEEERRCKVITEGSRRIELLVEMPVPGFRYGVAYQPKRADPIPSRARVIAARLTETIRQHEDSALLTNLRAATEASVEVVVGKGVHAIRWQALLWSDRTRRLETAFGRIPPGYWPVRFASGSGVAGHAFRFSRVAVWHRDSRPSPLIYLRQAEGQEWDPSHDWLVCVPILVSRTGPSIGVVSFEGGTAKDDSGPAGLMLGDLARLTREGVDKGSAAAKTTEARAALRENRLLTAVNLAFWAACAAETLNEFISPDDRRFARTVLETLNPSKPERPIGESGEAVAES